MMARLLRTLRRPRPGLPSGELDAQADEADAGTVAREAGEALVSALEESDAPSEVLHDVADDTAADPDRPRRWGVGKGGAVLLVLAAIVGLRRRRGR